MKVLTTIQIDKATREKLRERESYPRETYDAILLRLIELDIKTKKE